MSARKARLDVVCPISLTPAASADSNDEPTHVRVSAAFGGSHGGPTKPHPATACLHRPLQQRSTFEPQHNLYPFQFTTYDLGLPLSSSSPFSLDSCFVDLANDGDNGTSKRLINNDEDGSEDSLSGKLKKMDLSRSKAAAARRRTSAPLTNENGAFCQI